MIPKWIKRFLNMKEEKPQVVYAPDLEWKGEGTIGQTVYSSYLVKEAKLDLEHDYVGMLVIYFNDEKKVINVKTHYFTYDENININDLISKVHKIHHG